MQPVFISIDPERDSVKQVNSYVREFHPSLIGLTGPSDKVGLDLWPVVLPFPSSSSLYIELMLKHW